MSAEYTTTEGRQFPLEFIDREAVRIGPLPLMTTVQFAEHASHTLAEAVIPCFSPSERAPKAVDMRGVVQSIEHVPTLSPKPYRLRYENLALRNLAGRAHHDAVIAERLWQATQITYYADNPFVVLPGSPYVNFVNDGKRYHAVEPGRFYNIAHYFLVNYIAEVVEPVGTDPPQGIQPEIKDAVVRIEAALHQE